MYTSRYNRWLDHTLEDPDLAAELEAIRGDDDAIRDRFAVDLSFGTAGMRGVIGAGTNRMNIYTVRRATQGLANALNNRPSGGVPSVAIGYDSRIKSDLFARDAARVLAACGVQVWLYPRLQPVPLLSFAVRSLGADAGVMITASHNPAKYNGYKVYGADGCQMGTGDADLVLAEITRLDIFEDIAITDFDTALRDGKIRYIDDDVLENYYEHVLAQAVRPGLMAACSLKVVYSPLNGTGNIPVRHILARCGLKDIRVVPQQELPDGNFPTAPYPNPEIREALALGLELARQTGADLMLATDPDADRVGIAVRDTAGEYHLLSGNEVGVLLLDYICEGRKSAGTLPANPVMVKSIVTTPMADEVAKRHGIECDNVLTGFKYIGERILQLEQAGGENRFIFGFEESYGYLVGTYVRDKDAVVASMLICEMAAYYKTLGLTLYEAMDRLYTGYGRYLAEVDNFSFEGLSGKAFMDGIMARLRADHLREIGGKAVLFVSDYQNDTITELATGKARPLGLPQSNVLAYALEGGSLVTVRPSGTEPKVKIYYAVREQDLETARKLHARLAADMRPFMSAPQA